MAWWNDTELSLSLIHILLQTLAPGVFKYKDNRSKLVDDLLQNYKGGDLIQFIKNHINDFPQFQHQNTFVRINMILGH